MAKLHLFETMRRGAIAYVGDMVAYALRVQLPDRPGALGLVASRIGAVGGDITSIDILGRADGRAVDELVVELASEDLVDLLRSEVHEVDGTSLEVVRRIDPKPA